MKRPAFGVTAWGLAAAIIWSPAGALAASADWPTFQHDSAHSGAAASGSLRAPLQETWRVAVASEGWTFASAAVSDEMAFIGTLRGEVLALDRRTGQESWRYASDGAIYLTPAVSSGKVVFGSSDGSLVALNAADGRALWSFRTGSDIHASPAVAGGKVYFASNDGYAYSVDLETGVLAWKTLLSGRILASPAADGGRAYFATEAGRVAALAVADGSVLWDVSMPDHIRSAPSIFQGVLYIGGHDGKLRALDASDGSSRWSFDAGAAILNGLAVTADAVYSASLDGMVRAVDRSGGLIWAFDAGAQIHAAPSIAGDVLVIGTEANTLFLLRASSGTVLSQSPLPGRVSAPAALARGMIHVFTDDGSLTAFQSPNLPPSAPVDLAVDVASATFSWRFTDPDADDRQAAFSLDLATGAAVFDAPLFATGVRESADSSYRLESPLADGRYFWRVRTYDLFGASSPYARASFVVDRTAPIVTIVSPLGGERFVPGVNQVVVDYTVVDASDPAPVSSAFLVQLEDRGSPRGAAPERVAVSTGSVLSPLDLDDGLWRLEVAASDAVGNSTVTASGSFEVVHDMLPPRTELSVGSPQVEAGGLTAVTGATSFGLSSVDDLAAAGDGLGLGVALQLLSVDGVLRSSFTNAAPTPGQAFSSSFTLADADGIHVLSYRAQDTLGNLEGVRTATVAVDNTPPQTSLALVSGRESVAARWYVSGDARFRLTALDPVVGGASAGVAGTRLSTDGGAFAVVTGTFTFAEGAHELAYASEDRLGNAEAARSTSVAVDATPPVSAASVGSPSFMAGDGALYVSSLTPVSFTAADPSVAGSSIPGSGVALIEVSVDSAPFTPYASALTLGPGRHTLLYRATDAVGNAEAARSLELRVDVDAPQTALSVSSPSFGGYVSASTLLSLTAVDVIGETSGVAETLYRLNGGAYASGPLSFRLEGVDGAYAVDYRSRDNVGNLEVLRSSTVFLDATAPVSTVHVGSPSFSGADGTLYVAPGTLVSVAAEDAGSGVASVEVGVDGAALAPYAGPLTFPQGRHELRYRAVDRLGNAEAERVLALRSDATPPVTAFTPSGALIAGEGGALFAPGGFSYALTAADTVAEDVASGVAFTRYALDGGAFQTYAATFTLSEGARRVSFQSQDNVGNLELLKSATVFVDATAPQTALQVVGGRQHPAGGSDFYASSDTRIAFAAADPVVDGAASGVAFTRWRDGSGAFQDYSGELSLTEGAHAFAFQSQDRVGNLETLRAATALVDASVPVSVVSVGTPSYTAADGTVHATPATPFSVSAADTVLPTGQPGSGVERVEVSVDGGAYAPAASPLLFAEGAHSLRYRAFDRVGNAEAERVLAIQSDATPPVSTLTVSSASAGGFVSAAAVLTLSAVDPVVGGAASGVVFTSYRVNGGTFVTAPLSFGLSGADGVYTVEYRSQDRVGNLEALRSAGFTLDRTAPVTSVTVGAPSYAAQGGVLYVDPSTPVTFTATDSGSGVARIEVSVDGAPYVAFASALTFTEGRHSVLYRAVDAVGNIETARTLELRSDATAPMTTVQPSGSLFSALDGSQFAPGGFAYSFSAADPISGDVASGVAFTRFRTDSSAPGLFELFASTFGLSEGVRRVEFQSQDNVGNLELLRSATVFVDATPPVTALSVGAPRYASGSDLFVSTGTLFSLGSQDPVAHAVASGVSSVTFSVGAAAFASYGAPFLLSVPDGAADVSWRGVDNVGNLESVRSSRVLVDGTAPVTALAVSGGRQYAGYASADSLFSFTAADPAVNGAASGVAFTQWRDGSGAFAAYAAPLTLDEGAHALEYQSEDHVLNREVLRSTSVLVDAKAPVSAVSVGTPSYTAADGTVHATPATPFSVSAADPVLPMGQPGSGVERVEVSVDGGVYAPAAGPLFFFEGAHTLRYRSFDRVGNAEAERVLAIQSDATAPVTTLAVSSPSAGAFVSPATLLTLTAGDPMVGGSASGVASTSYRVNGGAFVTAPLSFGLSGPDGAYTVEYRSQDRVGNQEALRSASFTLDQTAPVTSVSIGAPSYTAADGTLYVDPATPVSFTAADSGSGVEHVEASIDGAPYAPYAATLGFPEGRHTVLYRAVDKVGNVEAARTLQLRSDATEPVTALQPSGTLFVGAGGASYAPSHFSYALTAVDPVMNDAASGVALTRYALDTGAFSTYVGTFTLTEGARLVRFQSADNLNHAELLKSATVFVDATAPVTALSVGAPKFSSGGTLFVSTATMLALDAQDPQSAGVASGVSAVSYRLGAGAFAPYFAPFTLVVPDGSRVVSWSATDNVGNVEALRSEGVSLDATAPLSSLLVIGGRQAAGPDAASFYASSDTRLAFASEDPAAGGAASGLAQILYQDNGGAFQVFGAPLSLGAGRHALGYRGVDNVSNHELLRSTTVLVDAAPPVTAVAVGAPTFTDSAGVVFVTPASLLLLVATDAPLPSGEPGAGVQSVELSVDGGPFAAVSGPLSFPEGAHELRYRAADRVGNLEVVRVLQLRSDATPPSSQLIVGSPSFPLLGGATLVSTRTPLSITAADPAAAGVASGVLETLYRVATVSPSTAPFAAYVSTFTISGSGERMVEFFSRDRVLNAELVRSRALVLDSTAPSALIGSPDGDGGICSVVKGLIPVRGSASDAYLAGYVLESAPGRGAATGFVLVSSGAAAVYEGLLGTWDARALSGWRTLRLTVTDRADNVSVASLDVFVGDPGRLLVLGSHETFNLPRGVAAGADGRIYVADTNADRVRVFSSTGGALGVYGGHEHMAPEFKKPQGVAVDASGAVFVADTENHRVLKLSATGHILLELGRVELKGKDGRENKPGRGAGEFRKPVGVAVDAYGAIYVADTDNNRVQKFSPNGGFLLSFDLPPATGSAGDEDGDCDRPDLGRPVGIALDGAGRIYVADPRGARALQFGATGQVLMSIPVFSEDDHGRREAGRPEGIAVSAEGGCIAVSDTKTSRIYKYDAAGAQTLVFGVHEKISDGKPLPRVLAMRKPTGLALDASGKLYVADRNNDRIQVFGEPTGGATLVVPPVGSGDDARAMEVVERDSGGEVERSDRAGVSIPAGALSEDLKISVSAPAPDHVDENDRQRDLEDRGLKVVSAPVEYGPHGTTFNEPVTLTIPYTAELLAAQGVDVTSLKVHYWNVEKRDWEPLESAVDAKSGTVKAKTPHFSVYQVVGSTGPGAAFTVLAADPSFGFKDLYAFPNPVRGRGPATIRVQPGLVDSITVRVYDLSGRKVHESSAFTDQGALDDGNGKGAQFTYDHSWDVSGIGSGVYTFVISAQKNGQRDIHKTGKVGVIK